MPAAPGAAAPAAAASKRRPWRARLGNKLRRMFNEIGVISIVTLLLLVGGTLGWITYDEYQQTQEAEYRLLEAHARNAEVQVAGALARIDRLLQRMAAEELKNRSQQVKAFSDILEHYQAELPELGPLLVSDAGGRIRSATDKALIGRNVSQEPFFTTHVDQRLEPMLFMSRPDKRLLDVTAIVFTLPIIGPQREFLGIVGVTIGYSFFPRILETINSDDSASMSVIVNRNGDLVYRRSEPEKFFGNNILKVSQVFHDHVQAGSQSSRHLGPSAQNGKPRLFVMREVGDTGLGLILSRQVDEILARWQRNTVIYLLIFIFSAILLILLELVAVRRKRQLLASKDFADQLIATANVMVVGLDSAGAVTIFNETAERISGYCRSEVLGRDWFELAVPAKAAASVRELFEEFRHGGTLPHSDEYPIRTKSGQERIISWQNSVLAAPRAAISFGIDITERKQMESNLSTAKRQAEEANAAKSKFLAAASHDLRQPIHAQGLFLELLGRTPLTPQQKEVLTAVRAASQASAEMLNTLLDFSRIEAGVIVPQIRPFPLQPLLNKIESELAPLADAKNIIYRSRETQVTILSDPALVELILRNLVANAIRYTERGGVLVACRRRGGEVAVEVWDTGIGIAADEQAEVFREFHQLGNPERDRRKGFGLGLAICKGLAQTLWHDLSLQSTPGQGSMFRLCLPLAKRPARPSAANVPAAEQRQLLLGQHVLVIDDDEAVRIGTLNLLSDWGCQGMAAESIEEALILAQGQRPDLVISDYRLRQQRTGAEAIAILRAVHGAQLPALLITGDTAPERLAEAQASGIPLLHKPVSTSELYRVLAALLASGAHSTAG
jgi:PAS domain S-box-containing protein